MSATIEVPRFWVFRKACGCVYGSLVADQTFNGWNPRGPIIVTAGQAWDDFYEGEKRRGNRDLREGCHATAENALPPVGEWVNETFIDGVCTLHGSSDR